VRSKPYHAIADGSAHGTSFAYHVERRLQFFSAWRRAWLMPPSFAKTRLSCCLLRIHWREAEAGALLVADINPPP
jgi:hypothetical protein